MNIEIKAIIFDFFGVIGNEVGEQWFRLHFPENEAKRLKPIFCDEADLGKVSFPQFIENLSNLISTSLEEVEKEWMGMFHINAKIVDLIKGLKLKYKIGLCTNSASSFIRPILENQNLKGLFDAIVISSDIGIIKPSPEIYLAILKELSINPQDALFIDDNEVHVKGAEAIGMPGILFETAEKLDTDLKKNGIK